MSFKFELGDRVSLSAYIVELGQVTLLGTVVSKTTRPPGGTHPRGAPMFSRDVSDRGGNVYSISLAKFTRPVDVEEVDLQLACRCQQAEEKIGSVRPSDIGDLDKDFLEEGKL